MTSAASSASVALPWSVRRRQLLAITRLELRRTAFTTRSVLAYLLAVLPLFAVGFMSAMSIVNEAPAIGFTAARFARIFASFFLRFVVFFGSLILFSGLIRRMDQGDLSQVQARELGQ